MKLIEIYEKKRKVGNKRKHQKQKIIIKCINVYTNIRKKDEEELKQRLGNLNS